MREPKTLLTYSLVSAWQWALNEYSGDTGFEDFMNTLNRVEKTSYTESQLKGIAFEDAVWRMANGIPEDGIYGAEYECAKQLAEVVKGGMYQYSANTEVDVDGHTFILYGKIDFLKAGVIHDIKRTSKYEVGKYYGSFQTNIYFKLVPNAYAFEYDVCDGKNVFKEIYSREETPPVEPTIRDFMNWLKANGLWETYLEKWKSKWE